MLDCKKMRALRERQELSQEDAAKAAGMSGRQQWYLIESGTRADVTLTTLDKIAKALGVKAKDLLR